MAKKKKKEVENYVKRGEREDGDNYTIFFIESIRNCIIIIYINYQYLQLILIKFNIDYIKLFL